MPGDSGVTVVTNSYAFYFAYEAAGASSARHSPRPLLRVKGGTSSNLARTRGETAELCLRIMLFEIKSVVLIAHERRSEDRVVHALHAVIIRESGDPVFRSAR
jgi:hypothetical protein